MCLPFFRSQYVVVVDDDVVVVFQLVPKQWICIGLVQHNFKIKHIRQILKQHHVRPKKHTTCCSKISVASEALIPLRWPI